jgi:transcriptional regulator with XRE-family HTH domain
MPINYAARVKTLRFLLGLTQEQFAKLFGVRRVEITRWEARDRNPNKGAKRLIDHFISDVKAAREFARDVLSQKPLPGEYKRFCRGLYSTDNCLVGIDGPHWHLQLPLKRDWKATGLIIPKGTVVEVIANDLDGKTPITISLLIINESPEIGLV